MLALIGLVPSLLSGNLISTLLKYWYLVLIAIAAAALVWFVWDWEARGAEIDTLNAANATLTQNLALQQQLATAAQAARDIATKRLQDATTRATAVATIHGVISHEKPSTVSSGLGAGTADALRWVREQSSGKAGAGQPAGAQ